MIDDERRRLLAKRANEGRKLTATLLNNLAVGVLVGGLIGPGVSGRDVGRVWLALLISAFFLHLVGQIVLKGLVSEE